MLFTFKIGMLLGLSIIISIGAQNLFVIKQGLRNEYPYLCALTCFLSDFILIILGVTGVSALIIEIPLIKLVMLVAGMLFLGIYGSLAIKRGFNSKAISESLKQLQQQTSISSSSVRLIILGLSFSLLNPHAILDTVVIIGSSANHYANELKYFFVAGTIVASLVWFLGLTVITKRFANKLMSIKFWQTLEFVSGAIMIGFAGQFLYQLLC